MVVVLISFPALLFAVSYLFTDSLSLFPLAWCCLICFVFYSRLTLKLRKWLRTCPQHNSTKLLLLLFSIFASVKFVYVLIRLLMCVLSFSFWSWSFCWLLSLNIIFFILFLCLRCSLSCPKLTPLCRNVSSLQQRLSELDRQTDTQLNSLRESFQQATEKQREVNSDLQRLVLWS